MTRSRRAPALLATNGFGGTKDDQADLAQGFGEHGYVTLSYTGIGFVDGDNCPITLDDREHDGAAASQLMRFLGGDPSIEAVDDATGAAGADQPGHPRGREDRHALRPRRRHDGGSYGGQIQFAAAAFERGKGTDRLDAIIPLITWNDLVLLAGPGEQRAAAGHGAQRLGQLRAAPASSSTSGRRCSPRSASRNGARGRPAPATTRPASSSS